MANGPILITRPITFHRRRATSRRMRSPPASRSGEYCGRVRPFGATATGSRQHQRGQRNVNINNFNRNNINNFNKWHNAHHRHGVKYNNADVRQKFAKTGGEACKAVAETSAAGMVRRCRIPAAARG